MKRALFITLVAASLPFAAPPAIRAAEPQPMQQPQTSPGAQQNGAAQAGPTAATEAAVTQTIQAATQVLADIGRDAKQPLPPSVLQQAAGVAIIPNLIKASFIIGGRHGTGVLLTHAGSQWSPPAVVTVASGSIGAQLGVTSTDLVMVFQTQQQIDAMIGGDLTFGADAVVAAGPTGAAVEEATRPDIYAYKRTGGLFAGVSLTGGVLSLDEEATATYYGLGQRGQEVSAYYPTVQEILKPGAPQPQQIPEAAKLLQEALSQYAAKPQQQSGQGQQGQQQTQ